MESWHVICLYIYGRSGPSGVVIDATTPRGLTPVSVLRDLAIGFSAFSRGRDDDDAFGGVISVDFPSRGGLTASLRSASSPHKPSWEGCLISAPGHWPPPMPFLYLMPFLMPSATRCSVPFYPEITVRALGAEPTAPREGLSTANRPPLKLAGRPFSWQFCGDKPGTESMIGPRT